MLGKIFVTDCVRWSGKTTKMKTDILHASSNGEHVLPTSAILKHYKHSFSNLVCLPLQAFEHYRYTMDTTVFIDEVFFISAEVQRDIIDVTADNKYLIKFVAVGTTGLKDTFFEYI